MTGGTIMPLNVEQIENRTDRMKTLVEWAIAYGRKLQSSQTGYLHYYYHAQEDDVHQAIPVFENVCFALALLRSRLVENAQEAKKILEGILSFQQIDHPEFSGNFPFYLHEYPACKDRSLSIQLLSPFYWILKSFGHVLGQELKIKMEKASCQLISHGLKTHEWKALPYSTTVRLAAGMQAFGLLLMDDNLTQKGKDLLTHYLMNKSVEQWNSTAVLADLIIALQMVYPSFIHSPWGSFWEYLSRTWHRGAFCYVGPGVKEWQQREEPQPTIYDLFMCYVSGPYSDRVKKGQLYHLHGALLQPVSDHLLDNCIPFYLKEQYQDQDWTLVYHSKWAYTLLEKRQLLQPTEEKTYAPFRLVWGDVHRTHTFVCQGGHLARAEYHLEPDNIQLLLELADNTNIEERGDQQEVEFYFDFHPGVQLKVEDKPATTFMLGQPLVLDLDGLAVKATFELLEGQGQFLGHFMRGNRPSQLNAKGDERFNAYDGQLFLRTVRRSGPCRIKLTMQILPSESQG